MQGPCQPLWLGLNALFSMEESTQSRDAWEALQHNQTNFRAGR
jgi:hypothetical protein